MGSTEETKNIQKRNWENQDSPLKNAIKNKTTGETVEQKVLNTYRKE
jgi:hypothetical protein